MKRYKSLRVKSIICSVLILCLCVAPDFSEGQPGESSSSSPRQHELIAKDQGSSGKNWPAINLEQAVPVAEIKSVQNLFHLTDLTADNFWAHTRDCVEGARSSASQASIDDFKRGLKDGTVMNAIRVNDEMNTYMTVLDKGFCIRFTDKGFPIYPGEALFWTVHPINVDQEFGLILSRVAGYISVRGRASVLFDLKDKQYIADYFVEHSPLVIQYRLSEITDEDKDRAKSADFRYSVKDGLIVYMTNKKLYKLHPLIHKVPVDMLKAQDAIVFERMVIN